MPTNTTVLTRNILVLQVQYVQIRTHLKLLFHPLHYHTLPAPLSMHRHTTTALSVHMHLFQFLL